MSLKLVFNPFTNKFDWVTRASTSVIIPEFTSDPVSPVAESAWVLRTPTSGTPIGLLLSLTYTTDDYQLSYRTLESTTVRTRLS